MADERTAMSVRLGVAAFAILPGEHLASITGLVI
jgi:hypothetical protein